jgi:hypothetical protein
MISHVSILTYNLQSDDTEINKTDLSFQSEYRQTAVMACMAHNFMISANQVDCRAVQMFTMLDPIKARYFKGYTLKPEVTGA